MNKQHLFSGLKLVGKIWLCLCLPLMGMYHLFYMPEVTERKYFLEEYNLYLSTRVDHHGLCTITVGHTQDPNKSTILRFKSALGMNRLNDNILIDSTGAIELKSLYFIGMSVGDVPVTRIKYRHGLVKEDSTKLMIWAFLEDLAIINKDKENLLKEIK